MQWKVLWMMALLIITSRQKKFIYLQSVGDEHMLLNGSCEINLIGSNETSRTEIIRFGSSISATVLKNIVLFQERGRVSYAVEDLTKYKTISVELNCHNKTQERETDQVQGGRLAKNWIGLRSIMFKMKECNMTADSDFLVPYLSSCHFLELMRAYARFSNANVSYTSYIAISISTENTNGTTNSISIFYENTLVKILTTSMMTAEYYRIILPLIRENPVYALFPLNSNFSLKLRRNYWRFDIVDVPQHSKGSGASSVIFFQYKITPFQEITANATFHLKFVYIGNSRANNNKEVSFYLCIRESFVVDTCNLGMYISDMVYLSSNGYSYDFSFRLFEITRVIRSPKNQHVRIDLMLFKWTDYLFIGGDQPSFDVEVISSWIIDVHHIQPMYRLVHKDHYYLFPRMQERPEDTPKRLVVTIRVASNLSIPLVLFFCDIHPMVFSQCEFKEYGPSGLALIRIRIQDQVSPVLFKVRGVVFLIYSHKMEQEFHATYHRHQLRIETTRTLDQDGHISVDMNVIDLEPIADEATDSSLSASVETSTLTPPAESSSTSTAMSSSEATSTAEPTTTTTPTVMSSSEATSTAEPTTTTTPTVMSSSVSTSTAERTTTTTPTVMSSSVSTSTAERTTTTTPTVMSSSVSTSTAERTTTTTPTVMSSSVSTSTAERTTTTTPTVMSSSVSTSTAERTTTTTPTVMSSSVSTSTAERTTTTTPTVTSSSVSTSTAERTTTTTPTVMSSSVSTSTAERTTTTTPTVTSSSVSTSTAERTTTTTPTVTSSSEATSTAEPTTTPTVMSSSEASPADVSTAFQSASSSKAVLNLTRTSGKKSPILLWVSGHMKQLTLLGVLCAMLLLVVTALIVLLSCQKAGATRVKISDTHHRW